MKTIEALCVVLLLATSAHAGKSHVQYEVAHICKRFPIPGDKTVWEGGICIDEVTDKRPAAVAIAKYLTDKSKALHFVVVEELDEKGDVK